MKRIFAATLALSALAACGDGNPFGAGGDAGDGTTVDSTVPETITGSFDSFAYDPGAGTLTITGLLRDGDTNPVTYVRKPALDQGVYTAFTLQDDPLDEHTTVYVRSLDDVSGAVAVSGGQFTFYSGGVQFARDGSYDPIQPDEGSDRGLVTYAGEYIGLTNLNGPDTDLLAAPGGITDSTVLPSQAGLVTGDIIINVEFDANNISGEVFNREVDSEAFGNDIGISDLVFRPGEVDADGNFSGRVEVQGNPDVGVGDYAGVIGGEDASVLAGGLFAEEHFGEGTGGVLSTVAGEEEYGVFVLGRCGGPNADAGVAACTGVDPE